MSMYRVHGLTRSYFTRKVTGYLDYTDRPWRLEPGFQEHSDATEAGWNGGIPVVVTPDDTPMWDSTSIIEHLDTVTPSQHSVLPDDLTLRFLAYLIDDFVDEWFYRPAVGSRWSYPDNTVAAGWQLAEELSTARGVPGATIRELVVATMTNSLPKLGVSAENIDAWMSETVAPWFEVLDAHLGAEGYLFGSRPSIADFALFGANVAHFVGDPYCRVIADEHGPNVVAHTHRLMVPGQFEFGDWIDATEVPASLIAVVAEMGRHYLPWMAAATVDGSAAVTLREGVETEIASSSFLDRARGVMLARYVAARSDELDSVLERAGVLQYFADHVEQATSVPDPAPPAQPSDNRPYAVN